METFLRHYINIGKMVCIKTIKRLMSYNYYSARAFYKYQLRRSGYRCIGQQILIYQFGKTGSTTVQKSLEALKLDMPIYHVHFLSQERIAKLEEISKKVFSTEKNKGSYRITIPWLCQYLRKQVDKSLFSLNGNKWNIVTPIREPIARNISAFFQQLEVEILGAGCELKIKSFGYDFETVVKLEDSMNVLTDLFLEKVNHDNPLMFFDLELKAVLGIDVYASEFPKSKGYKIYKEKRSDVLVIRLENLYECAQNAFKEFLNVDRFKLINENVGSEKHYAHIYRMFKDSVVLSDSYIEKMYRSKYMKHFYSEEEIKKFKKKYTKSA